jgi:predicted MPP superfamily phosphohydrolase
MRFIPVLIIIVVMAFLPSVLYSRRELKQKHVVTGGIVAAYAIPTILILLLILLQFATRSGIVDFKIMQWALWGFMLAILPTNVYALFYIIDKIIKLFTKKSCQTLHYIGAILALIVAICLIVGMATRHCIQVREVTIYSKNLPKEFDGIRIAHITDLHFGNLSPRDSYLQKIVTKLNEIDPDMLVCTGDMMNLTAEEVNGLDRLFTSINAPLGRYAVMGNHDYGDYSKWESAEAKQANLMAAYEAYRRVGFVLLNDSAVQITDNKLQITDNTTLSTLNSKLSTISVIGVENWGKPPFPRYGDLSKATKGFEPAQFNILLSHDPNHWKSEVSSDNKYKYIDLTLSGHTHSAQIGIELGESKWSPSQWIFEYWDGLYEKDGQYLFVSRGLGYVGIPFRLGMPAEISVIELKVEN